MYESLLSLVDHAVSRWPELPYALGKTDSGWKSVSFSETKARARAFSAWLLEGGFAPGQRGGILSEGSPEWIQGELGLLGAGMVSVPLSAKLTVEELRYRLLHSGAVLLLVSRNLLDQALAALGESMDIRLVLLDGAASEAAATAARRDATPEASPAASPAAHAPFYLETAIQEGFRALAGNPNLETRLAHIASSIKADSLAFISYTSGTAGNPKAVMLSHRNILTNSHDASVLFTTPRYRTLLVLPADHAFIHTVAIYTALWSGVALHFLDTRGGALAGIRNIAGNMQECQPDFMLTVPALSTNIQKRIEAGVRAKSPLARKLFRKGLDAEIRRLGDGLHRPAQALRLSDIPCVLAAKLFIFPSIRKKVFGASIKFCVSGGSRSDAEQERFFTALGLHYLAGYGLTEASPIVSANVIGSAKFGTVGKPVPSVRVAILDEKGCSLPAGKTGEIALSGDSVMLGYYKDPESTAQTIHDGWLHTGDLGFLDEDGFLSIVGRNRSLLVSASGEKYSPEPIEEAITASSHLVERVMVWCMYKKYSCALVSLDKTQTEAFIDREGIRDADALCEALRREIYRFTQDPARNSLQKDWIPVVFQILENPLSEADGSINSTLKLVRRRVEELHRELLDYSYTKEGSRPDNPRNIAALNSLFFNKKKNQ